MFVLAYDSDKAGQAATLARFSLLFWKTELKVKVVKLPQGVLTRILWCARKAAIVSPAGSPSEKIFLII